MELVPVDTQRAYDLVRQRITTLELPPGAPLNEAALAEELGLGAAAVREALKLLAHEGLVLITPRHGLYVAEVSIEDLERFSELRSALESLSARLAAQRANADDLAVLEALRREQASAAPDDSRRLFELDHRLHQAIAQAAHNQYLGDVLERFFGLSQRLWYLALPRLDALSSAVHGHVEVVEAIQAREAGRAEAVMRAHVEGFYRQVIAALRPGGEKPCPR